MRIKTVRDEIYCNNCSYQVIAVDTEIERHLYCDNCGNYEVKDLNETKDCKCS